MPADDGFESWSQCVLNLVSLAIAFIGMLIFIACLCGWQGDEVYSPRENWLAFACWAVITGDAIDWWVDNPIRRRG